MKKHKNLVIFIIVAVFLSGAVLLLPVRDFKVESFSIDEYEYYTSGFSSGRVLGPIDDANTAVSKAKEVWREVYGNTVTIGKSCSVLFDEENQIWLVHCRVPILNWKCGPYILMQKSDGRVLALWNGKF